METFTLSRKRKSSIHLHSNFSTHHSYWLLNYLYRKLLGMIVPEIPLNEAKRQEAVEKYKLLDTMPEESYDNITSIVSSICKAPIALITLIDRERNYFKAKLGVDINEAPRDLSFCSHAINQDDDIMIVPDARKDVRFIDNPIVDEFKTVFYAGVQLIDKNGFKLGTLCVYDHKPRRLNEQQIKALKALAKNVMLLFEQRYQNYVLEQTEERLRERNEELKDFAGIVSHDLKAPLSNVMMIGDLLLKKEQNLSKQSVEYIDRLKDSAGSMSRYIDGMLTFYKSDELVTNEYDEVSYIDIIEDVISMTVLDNNTNVIYRPTQDTTILTNQIALEQILINLVTNSVKYGDKDKTVIEISLDVQEENYVFTIRDNGSGIASNKLPSVFKLFYTAAESDKNGQSGTGIGLATVSRLLEHMEGKIHVASELGQWTEFTVTLPIPRL
ncbi:MAG: GAF domain-containing sensor histidine kinase [Nonlabens sp.]